MLNLQSDLDLFSGRLFAQLEALHLDVSPYVPDHVCFRVCTEKEYLAFRDRLSLENDLLTESLVRGRLIATFKLRRALKLGSFNIDVIEIPAPKIGSPYPTGFEHVEFVIGEPFASFIEKYPNLRSRFEVRAHEFCPPEMSLALEQMSVKFHYDSLQRTIALENGPDSQKRLIVFDLDGTLVDSNLVIDEVNRKLLTDLGANPDELARTSTFPSTFAQLLSQFRVENQNLSSFANRWGDEILKRPVELFAGVREVLEKIGAIGIPMALWTARDARSAGETLRRLGIDRYFSRVWAFHEAFAKPHLEGFDFLANGRAPQLVTFIGDSKTDQEAALTAGCNFRWAQESLATASGRELFLSELLL